MTDGFDLPAHARAMRAAGWWRDKTFDDLPEAAGSLRATGIGQGDVLGLRLPGACRRPSPWHG